MINTSLSISFTKEDSSTSSTVEQWARLEEVYEEESKEAKINDVTQMLARVKAGLSAFSYIKDVCPYATTDGETITIALDFYVYVSDLALPYKLHTSLGTISRGVLTHVPKSFQKVFQGSSSEELDWLFEGTATPLMPYFTKYGVVVPDVVVGENGKINGTSIVLSDPVYTVLKVTGNAIGYKHTITMDLTKEWGQADAETTVGAVSNPSFSLSSFSSARNFSIGKIIHNDGAIAASWRISFTSATEFDLYDSEDILIKSGNINVDFKTQYFTIKKEGWDTDEWYTDDYLAFTVKEQINNTGYSIINLKNSVGVSWVNEDGKTDSTSIVLTIPQCVEDLLTECPEDNNSNPLISMAEDVTDNMEYRVYHNTCKEDDIVQEGWVTKDEQ